MCFESTKTQNAQTGSTTSLPSWLTSAGQQVGQQAAGYTANSPYVGYSGPTEAGFGQTFGTAESAATNQLAQGNASFNSGLQALAQGLGLAGTTASTPVSALMSQYTNAALQPTLQAIQQQAAQNNQGVAQQATMSGAFGDTGYGAAKALNDYNTTQAVSGATGTAYNNAYNSALQTQQTALSQLLGGVGQASGLGSSSSSAQTSIESLLANLGSTVQQAGQTGINTAINVNQSNQLGQLQQDSLASSILGTVPKDVSTTGYGNSQTTQPDNSAMGLLGTLLGGSGVQKTLGNMFSS